MGGGLPIAGDCPCNADIVPTGGDGTVDVSDLLRIEGCLGGTVVDPACDINCDGVVNLGDLSASICQFQGGGPTCCSDVGACCLFDGGCTIAHETVCPSAGGPFAGAAFHGVGTLCDSACCCKADIVPAGGDGTVDVSDLLRIEACLGGTVVDPDCDINCDGGVDLSDLSASICQFQGGGPTCCTEVGACCLLDSSCTMAHETVCPSVGGPFMDAAFHGVGTSCGSACCCDADIVPPGGDGTVDVSDLLRLEACLGGTVVDPACDINCDGVVDFADLGAASCRFQSGGPTCCTEVGACCLATGGCVEVHSSICPSLGGPFLGGSYLGDATACATSCCRDLDCTFPDADVCTCDECIGGVCISTPVRYGNADCAGPPTQADLDDILCVLQGFSNIANCPNGDIAPIDNPAGGPLECAGNNVIDLDDIIRVLEAFAGGNPCGCLP